MKALNDTVCHYKYLYFENDFYRMKRLLDMQNIEKSEADKRRSALDTLNNFFHSPFKDDKRFMIRYLAMAARDRLSENKYLIDQLFFDKIFKLMIKYKDKDEQNVLQAYDLICNLLMDEEYRARLRDKGYINQIYDSVNLYKVG